MAGIGPALLWDIFKHVGSWLTNLSRAGQARKTESVKALREVITAARETAVYVRQMQDSGKRDHDAERRLAVLWTRLGFALRDLGIEKLAKRCQIAGKDWQHPATMRKIFWTRRTSASSVWSHWPHRFCTRSIARAESRRHRPDIALIGGAHGGHQSTGSHRRGRRAGAAPIPATMPVTSAGLTQAAQAFHPLPACLRLALAAGRSTRRWRKPDRMAVSRLARSDRCWSSSMHARHPCHCSGLLQAIRGYRAAGFPLSDIRVGHAGKFFSRSAVPHTFAGTSGPARHVLRDDPSLLVLVELTYRPGTIRPASLRNRTP